MTLFMLICLIMTLKSIRFSSPLNFLAMKVHCSFIAHSVDPLCHYGRSRSLMVSNEHSSQTLLFICVLCPFVFEVEVSWAA